MLKAEVPYVAPNLLMAEVPYVSPNLNSVMEKVVATICVMCPCVEYILT